LSRPAEASARRGRTRGRPDRIVGVVARRGRFQVVEPLFERGGQLPIARGKLSPDPGAMVLAQPAQRGVRVTRLLGSPQRARDVVEALMWEGLERRGFARRLEEDARAAIPGADEVDPGRRDLRDLRTFTVDPATARDFDDAVSAEPDGDGLRLWIHIADVSAHVRPGSALDAEAGRRTTSVYVPGTVEPMLPRALSDEACSLVPGVDRLAVTAEISLGADAAVRSAAFYRSRIRSDARLDYDQLDEIFAGRAEAPAEVEEPLRLARRAAAALAERRPVGALEIESFEPEFEFDAEGGVVAAHGVAQTEAHRLIEHLMILANERVADLLERRKAATLYRVHEQPDPERILRLFDQLASLDVPTPPAPDRLSPREAGALAGDASRLVAAEARRRGHGRDAYASLVLRSLKQAYYSERNAGHAGLGSPAYCHFTSPIRRYPDLIAHRALLAAVNAGEAEPDPADVREAGWRCSERERDAMRIERRADRVCASFLLDRELFENGWGRNFEGEVSGLVGAGAFVRFAGALGDVYEGFVPARVLRGERFDLNETETALVGRRTGREVRLGDPMAVRVHSVEPARGRADLEPTYGDQST
jgi:ribonuclease R